MAANTELGQGRWSSSLVFVLAATGSAVGLGNIWKFPYITGEYGGGAFVLVYLACIALIGVPIMVAEIALGRRGRRSPVNTLRSLVKAEGRSRGWIAIGWLGVLTGFLILSFYSVVAGWALAYVVRAAQGVFAGASAEQTTEAFGALLSAPWALLGWHTLFMLMVFSIVAQGVRKGLERALDLLMPLLFVLLLMLVGYGVVNGNFGAAAAFLFAPDFSALTGEGVLVAMGHAFFTLSLGMGAIMVYGAYLPQSSSIGGTTLYIAAIDTLVAILAGLAIFSIVFGFGMDADGGPGLLFVTLPLAFGHMPGGTFFGFVFFALVAIAALTSAISILEPVVAYTSERSGWGRPAVTALMSALVWLLGVGSVLSFNVWEEVAPLGVFEPLAGMTVFDLMDRLTTNILLPLGGLLIAVFAGWRMREASMRDELAMQGLMFRLWLFAVRFVAPLAVLAVFLHGFGVF
jgi:neurotransmitter:Na+ symporter, NSS family